VQDSQANRNARSTGIPVPVPPPVAAFRTDTARPDTAPETPVVDRNSVNSGKASPVQESSAPSLQENREKPLQDKPDSAVAEVSMPVFDVVRVNPEGDALIAGRAPAGAEIGIYDGERRAGTVVADGRGEWVFLPGNHCRPASVKSVFR